MEISQDHFQLCFYTGHLLASWKQETYQNHNNIESSLPVFYKSVSFCPDFVAIKIETSAEKFYSKTKCEQS